MAGCIECGRGNYEDGEPICPSCRAYSESEYDPTLTNPYDQAADEPTFYDEDPFADDCLFDDDLYEDFEPLPPSATFNQDDSE